MTVSSIKDQNLLELRWYMLYFYNMFGITFKAKYIRRPVIQAWCWLTFKCAPTNGESLEALITACDSAQLTVFPFFNIPVFHVE